jgi:hypothetical protein
VIKLAAEIRSLIAQNQSLQAQLDAEVAKIGVKNIQENQTIHPASANIVRIASPAENRDSSH